MRGTLVAELRAVVYMSWGTWVTRCPRPWCVHQDHYGRGPNTGRIGGLSRTTWTCLRCELVCEADWPDNAEDIAAVLLQRPMYETRNWHPGETIDDLLMENVTHGVVDVDSLTAGPLTGNNQLTAAGRRLVATGPAMHAIGA